MKIHRVGGQVLAQRLIVDVEIKRIDVSSSFVGHRDARPLVKRHWEKRIQRFIRGHGERSRFKKEVVAKTETKKIADWSLDTWRGFVVPIHSQDEFLEVIFF